MYVHVFRRPCLVLLLLPLCALFAPAPSHGRRPMTRGSPSSHHPTTQFLSIRMEEDNSIDEQQLRDEIAAMRVKQIKEELTKLGARHDDAFEKDDLVQRLLDARRDQVDDDSSDDEQAAAPPTFEQTLQATDMVMSDPEGAAIMEEVQTNEKLMKAAMDIAANGLTDKYADDDEVMDFMRRLEAITKRGMKRS